MLDISFFRRYFGHLHTINMHKIAVFKRCFRLGLYWQGLVHDFSKYSPAEFFVGVKYFQGFRSPNIFERERAGYSSAWLHHKGRNKHHYEYRNDLIGGKYSPVKMPMKYVKEMFCDMIAAGVTYRGKDFKNSDPYNYFYANTDFNRIHKDTVRVVDHRLKIFKEKGEKETFQYIKQNYKNSMGQNY